MTTNFRLYFGLLQIPVAIEGPFGRLADLKLAFDTGAATTVIDARRLRIAGCDTAGGKSLKLVTGSGEEGAKLVVLRTIEALGERRENFQVAAYPFPHRGDLHGVLGLDFVAGRRFTVDMAERTIELHPPSRTSHTPTGPRPPAPDSPLGAV